MKLIGNDVATIVNYRPGRPVISADAKDENFGNDNDAIPDMTADELGQARQYIIRGEGEMPVRKGHIVRRGAVKPAPVLTRL